MRETIMFTSESVTSGHPDKLCDQISDAVVDQFLIQDPYARIRVECAVSSAILFIAANFASIAKVDLAHVARKVIKKIGYDQPDFNASGCSILTAPKALPIDEGDQFPTWSLTDDKIESIPAKNQVTLFGFACNQSPVMIPLPIYLAHLLARRLEHVRKQLILPYLSPDGKVQVGICLKDGKFQRVHSVTVTACQRAMEKPGLETLRADIKKAVVLPVFDEEGISLDSETHIHVNPDGPHLGGPPRHSGLSGRKNAIDTYGEYCRHSGKALSGKDPLRIDRVGAYAARYAAKNVVAAGLAQECEVMLSYSIGQTRPVSLHVNTFGTGRLPDARISELVAQYFDFRLAGILKKFDLRRLPALNEGGFFKKLAAYGHFGRTDMDLPWEKVDLAEILASAHVG